MARTGQQRLAAIEPALEAKAVFLNRVKDAEGDVIRLADLMAQAITAKGMECSP